MSGCPIKTTHPSNLFLTEILVFCVKIDNSQSIKVTKVAKKKIVRINNQYCKSDYLPYCRSDKHLKGVTGNVHLGLTRVRSIRFFLFEIKRVLVYNSITFKLTDSFILYFSFKAYMPTQSQLSDILTEPINTRVYGV